MYNIMDLCVECKACKAECPSSVDMAKIKFEFLAHYYKHNPVPLRVKLFADIAFWSHLGSGMLAPLSNFMLKNRAVRWAIDKWLGISRQRPLPEMAAMPFTLWFKHRQKQRANGQITKGKSQRANHKGQIDRQGAPDLQSPVSNPQKKVVLFNDTFNTYNYPHVAIAATEVLEAAGFEVILPGHKCCGRPMISKGLVEQARRAAADTVVRLLPLAQQGLPIVGLEPGCLLSIRDEYFDLLPGDPRVKTVADQCYTFEEFIANLAQAGEFDLPLNGSARPVLLHGHCHQKSLVGTEPAFQTLNLPGHTVTEVDSGCCGMAGSFGYEAEHYDISMAMAERRLLPAVRQQSDDTLIAAAGVSCRQQILHGTGRQALHPAEILRAALQE
jgi:Fe-S oxidoreductase